MKKNMTKWLVDLQKHIGDSVIVVLIVEEGKIRFYNCLSKKEYFNESDDEEVPEKDILQNKKIKHGLTMPSSSSSYIG